MVDISQNLLIDDFFMTFNYASLMGFIPSLRFNLKIKNLNRCSSSERNKLVAVGKKMGPQKS